MFEDIKLYTGANCSACKVLKERLHTLELCTLYTECDTSEDKHRSDLMALGFRSIPVLVRYDKDGGVLDYLGGSSGTDKEYDDFFFNGFEEAK